MARILTTSGGAVYLAIAGHLPWWGPLVILGCIAMPSQAGAIVDIIRRRAP